MLNKFYNSVKVVFTNTTSEEKEEENNNNNANHKIDTSKTPKENNNVTQANDNSKRQEYINNKIKKAFILNGLKILELDDPLKAYEMIAEDEIKNPTLEFNYVNEEISELTTPFTFTHAALEINERMNIQCYNINAIILKFVNKIFPSLERNRIDFLTNSKEGKLMASVETVSALCLSESVKTVLDIQDFLGISGKKKLHKSFECFRIINKETGERKFYAYQTNEERFKAMIEDEDLIISNNIENYEDRGGESYCFTTLLETEQKTMHDAIITNLMSGEDPELMMGTWAIRFLNKSKFLVTLAKDTDPQKWTSKAFNKRTDLKFTKNESSNIRASHIKESSSKAEDIKVSLNDPNIYKHQKTNETPKENYKKL